MDLDIGVQFSVATLMTGISSAWFRALALEARGSQVQILHSRFQYGGYSLNGKGA